MKMYTSQSVTGVAIERVKRDKDIPGEAYMCSVCGDCFRFGGEPCHRH